MIHEEISYSVNKIPVGHGSHPERNSKQYQISYINPRLKFLIQTQQRSYEKFDGHPLPSFVEHRIWQPQLQDMPTTVYQSHAGRTFVEHRAISLREHERISDRGLDRRIDRSGSRTETCTYSRQYEDSRFFEFSRHTIHVLVRLKRNDGLEKRWPVQSRRVKPFSCVGERQVLRRVFLNRGSIHDISLTIFAQIRWQLAVGRRCRCRGRR